MRRFAIAAFLAAILVIGVLILVNYFGSFDELKHDTNRWAVIEDVNGDRIAVEPTDDNTWEELVRMNRNGTEMWVGGKVEGYSNRWGFRFKPDTITAAEVVAEGLQATIEFISKNIEYWEKLGWAYVSSKVVEIHS